MDGGSAANAGAICGRAREVVPARCEARLNCLKCRHSAALASAEKHRCAASLAEPILLGTTPPRYARSHTAAPMRATFGSQLRFAWGSAVFPSSTYVPQ